MRAIGLGRLEQKHPQGLGEKNEAVLQNAGGV
jgi:hypothetical protein